MEAAEATALAKKALKIVVPYIKAELRKDKANRYSLKSDWTLPVVKKPLRDFENEAFEIVTDGKVSVITVKAFDSTKEENHCDGASCAPDVFLGVDFRPGACFHDRWYEYFEELAEALGLTLKECRKLGDEIFASINYAENGMSFKVKVVNTIYFRAVRLFGGFYHSAKRGGKAVLAVVLMALCLSGCAGCVGTIFDDDGAGYTPPDLEKVLED